MDEGTAPPEASAKEICGQPTANGSPCQRTTLANADRCQEHGLPPTEAQASARRRSKKHGLFLAGLGEDEKDRYRGYLEELEDTAPVKRHLAAYGLVRLDRVSAWEVSTKVPSSLTAVALDAARRNVNDVPQREGGGDDELDPVQVARIVHTLAQKPEIFLKRLDPAVAEEVRAILRKAGALP